MTVGRSSKRGVSPPTAARPVMLATGIMGGMADPACAAGPAPAAVAGTAAAPELIDGAPTHADGTDRAPIDAARPMPALTAEVLPLSVTRLLEPTAPVAALSPLFTTEPMAPAPAVAALAAVFVPPVMNIRMSMLIGIIAIRKGMVSVLSDDSDDRPDVLVDDVPDTDVSPSKTCGAASPCNACGAAEITCGPADITVSACVAKPLASVV